MIGVADKAKRLKELKFLGVSWVSKRRPGTRSRSCWKRAGKLRFRFRLRAASMHSGSKGSNRPVR
jgi:hypothetical protein